MRDQFLLDPGLVFLNHGSYGACPRPVLEAQQRWQHEMERNPVAFLGRRSSALLGEARERLSAALGADAADLAFVTNATTGVNIVAQSWPLAPGDEVLATDHEYGACEATWRHVCAKAGAHYRRVEIPLPFEPGRFVERMMAAVTPRTRLVFASHISSTTALVFPVAALVAAARERGLATLIDGAHAPGQLPLALDALGADFYTGNCHKWWCAPKGAAFLHARRQHHARLHAPVVSWGYVAEQDAGSGGHTGFDAYAGTGVLQRRLQWLGTRDLSAFLSVPAALDFLREQEAPRRLARARTQALQTMRRVLARNGLAAPAPEDAFAQLVPIPVRSHAPEALREQLCEAHGIEVPVTTHGGQVFVRVSAAPYTTGEELQALELALQKLGA